MTAEEKVAFRNAVQAIASAVESGAIASENYQKLVEYHGLLSKPNAGNHITGQFQAILNAVNFHMIRATLESVEKRARKTERWIIALAVAALISSVVQIFSPWLFQSQPAASLQQTPVAKSETPYLVPPQVSDQAKKKTP